MTTMTEHQRRDLVARVAAWRVATRVFREHFHGCAECGPYLCSEGLRLDVLADEATASLPYGAINDLCSAEAVPAPSLAMLLREDDDNDEGRVPVAAALVVAACLGAIVWLPILAAIYWRHP